MTVWLVCVSGVVWGVTGVCVVAGCGFCSIGCSVGEVVMVTGVVFLSWTTTAMPMPSPKQVSASTTSVTTRAGGTLVLGGVGFGVAGGVRFLRPPFGIISLGFCVSVNVSLVVGGGCGIVSCLLQFGQSIVSPDIEDGA